MTQVAELNEEEEIYEVEKIIKHRKKNDRTQYLLKWKGYPDAENCWAFEDDLNCPAILADYWYNHNDDGDVKKVLSPPPPQNLSKELPKIVKTEVKPIAIHVPVIPPQQTLTVSLRERPEKEKTEERYKIKYNIVGINKDSKGQLLFLVHHLNDDTLRCHTNGYMKKHMSSTLYRYYENNLVITGQINVKLSEITVNKKKS